ncbi:hypothetical protein D3C76_1588070 [compost metagenome]
MPAADIHVVNDGAALRSRHHIVEVKIPMAKAVSVRQIIQQAEQTSFIVSVQHTGPGDVPPQNFLQAFGFRKTAGQHLPVQLRQCGSI